MKKSLSGDTIKYIAIAAMLLDHIAWTFLRFDSPAAQLFHIIGRITAPIMCFFIVQGFIHTRDVRKYLFRLLFFALISQYPWCLMHNQKITQFPLNMIFTLFFALLAVCAEAKISNAPLRIITVFGCAAATMKFDWCFFAVLWSAVFYKYRDNERKKLLYFSLISLAYTAYIFLGSVENGADLLNSFLSCLFTLGTFLCLPLLASYNENIRPNKKSKYVFYFFYPAHMLILGIIKGLIS